MPCASCPGPLGPLGHQWLCPPAAGRRTSLRFYSNSGDLFHAVEVPMSRGPKSHGKAKKNGMTWKGLKTWQGNHLPMFIGHVIMSCPFCCSFNHDAAWSILKHLGAVSFLLELLGFPLELWGRLRNCQEPSTVTCTWRLQHHIFPCTLQGHESFWSSRCLFRQGLCHVEYH